MFFDEPVTAFANIRRHLAPAGRLAFVCWQAVERNPWFVGPALAAYVPPPPPPAPGKSPTGPFSLSDPERVGEILAGAGWTSVTRTPHELVTTIDRDAVVDDGQLRFLGVPDASFDDARRAVDAYLAPLQTAEGASGRPLGPGLHRSGVVVAPERSRPSAGPTASTQKKTRFSTLCTLWPE